MRTAEISAAAQTVWRLHPPRSGAYWPDFITSAQDWVTNWVTITTNTCGLRRILPHLFPQVPPRSFLVISQDYYAYKRRVTGSNPVAPTRSEGMRGSLIGWRGAKRGAKVLRLAHGGRFRQAPRAW